MEIQLVIGNPSISIPVRPYGERQNVAAPRAVLATASGTTTDRATIFQAAFELAAGEAAVSRTPDFKSIPSDAVLGTLNGLIKSGTMSLDESTALMAFVPRNSMDLGLRVYGAPPSSMKTINLFLKLDQIVDYNSSIGNRAAVVYAQKAIDALIRIEG